MTADGCAYVVAEVCIEHLEYWDNLGLKQEKNSEIEDSIILEKKKSKFPNTLICMHTLSSLLTFRMYVYM